MQIEVTSVSRKPQRLSDAAAAVYVITGEEIRRSGATQLPEVLRLAPGLQVARIDAHTWAVGARGFNSQFSNKLLVLVDGRSVYTPAFSGVYWDAHGLDLEDVDRIEVIRGPGATVWGANAVNGVINIITKPASASRGYSVASGGGTENLNFARARAGSPLGENAHLRTYGRWSRHDQSRLRSGEGAEDDWWSARAGFRLDWDGGAGDLATLQGNLQRSELGQVITLAKLDPPYFETTRFHRDVRDLDLLGRWARSSDATDLTVQLYYERSDRRQLYDDEVVETIDLDVGHRFGWAGRQEIVWGLGYRLVQDRFRNTFTLTLDPERRRASTVSAFVQDELAIVRDRLSVTLGSKLERNDYTGVEFQPSARLTWVPGEHHTLWAAASRAARTPSRWEQDVRINVQATPGPTVVSVFGSPEVQSEELTALELGFRTQPHTRAALDVATFYNAYRGLRSFEPGTPYNEPSPPPDHAVIPLVVDNKLAAETWGVELSARCLPIDAWRLDATYTYLELEMRRADDSQDPSFEREEGSSPEQQVSLRSSLDLPGGLELDAGVRIVDRLPALRLFGYAASDVRLGWRPRPELEVSLAGLGLGGRRSPEFLPAFLNTQVTRVEGELSAKIQWTFGP
jgi:iron complex outermembrane recepter protein